MEFFIRQGATDPILKMRLIDDGKNDKSSINDMLESADIVFDMFDVKNNEYTVLNQPCSVTTRTTKFNYDSSEYYIVYRFTSEDTTTIGRFEGKITITFTDGNILIVPLAEKLFINVIS
jgi:hypothetical protein